MKKIIAIVLALVMVLSLAACGTKSSANDKVHLVSIASEYADKLIAKSPYYAKDTIKADVYGMDADADTVAVAAMVLASNDLPEATVYDFLSTIMNNKDEIGELHGKGKALDLTFATSVTAVPFHPGAAKYYAEQGVTVDNSGKAGDNDASDLTFATGGETGTYYGYGTVLAQYVSNNTNLSVTAKSSGGSKANIEDIDGGDVAFGFSQSDVMAYAYTGTNSFAEAGKIDSFSAVAALYMEQVQIVAIDGDIKTVADLKGKTVSVGAVGSGTYFNAVDILDVYGLTLDDIKPVYQSFGDSAESLKDGKIDAAFIVAGAPTNAIADLAATK